MPGSPFSIWPKRTRAPANSVDLSLPYDRCPMVAVDLETNSLDPKNGHILSIGMVNIERGEILLSSCQHLLIDADQAAGSSATIHGIRDIDRRDGYDLYAALLILQEAIQGRVLIFHHAQLDMAFLNIAAVQEGMTAFKVPVIDTLLLEQKRLQHSGTDITKNSLTLEGCRQRYRLPAAPRHNALEDAYATAELALVLCHEIGGSKTLPAKSFVSSKYY